MSRYFIRLFAFCLMMVSLYAAEVDQSQLMDSPFAGHKIEIFCKKGGASSSKLLLFLHGASGKGLKGLDQEWLDLWWNKGYSIAAISMPGYGASTGQKDFCGPFTLESLHSAIDAVKSELSVSELGIIGHGQGGIAALLLAAQREDICCLVVTNGGYDFFRHREDGDNFKKILIEKGYDFDLDDDHAVAIRSPIQQVKMIKAPLFLIHRGESPVILSKEAADFCSAMRGENNSCHLAVIEKGKNPDPQIPEYEEILEALGNWVDETMELKSDARF